MDQFVANQIYEKIPKKLLHEYGNTREQQIHNFAKYHMQKEYQILLNNTKIE